jgi:hypothetical protein
MYIGDCQLYNIYSGFLKILKIFGFIEDFFKKKIFVEILGVKNQKIKILTKHAVKPINSECFLSLTFSSVFKTVDVTALPVNLCWMTRLTFDDL